MSDSLQARITGGDVNTAYRRGYVHGAVRTFEVVQDLDDAAVIRWLDELMQWRDDTNASYLHPPTPPFRSRHLRPGDPPAIAEADVEHRVGEESTETT